MDLGHENGLEATPSAYKRDLWPPSEVSTPIGYFTH